MCDTHLEKGGRVIEIIYYGADQQEARSSIMRRPNLERQRLGLQHHDIVKLRRSSFGLEPQSAFSGANNHRLDRSNSVRLQTFLGFADTLTCLCTVLASRGHTLSLPGSDSHSYNIFICKYLRLNQTLLAFECPHA